MTNVIRKVRFETLGITLLVLILALVSADLIADWGMGVPLDHLVVEAMMFLIAAAGVVALAVRLLALRRESRELQQELATSREEAERWRTEAADLLAGLSAAIDRQFDRWRLTPAERHVAFLLLRGLSHQRIAGVRGASERTVRQQAHVLYRKAGLASRADLAAFFLDGLLRPLDQDSLSDRRT